MKTALITGAGRGIGLSLTKEFVAHDYKVIATYRNEKNASELLDLAKTHKQIIPVTADVADEKSFSQLKTVLEQTRKIDILINNSGVIGSKNNSIHQLQIKDVLRVFDVNTFGPMRITQLVIPYMNQGTIAHITSQMGSIDDNRGGGYYDYRMSKAALNMFNKCLSIEYPKIKCLVLHPGWVQTSMGGDGAPVPPSESARGLFEVITSSDKSKSGHFYDFKGREIPW